MSIGRVIAGVWFLGQQQSTCGAMPKVRWAYLGNSTVQVNYYWYEGQHTLTISWGGTFNKFGSK